MRALLTPGRASVVCASSARRRTREVESIGRSLRVGSGKDDASRSADGASRSSGLFHRRLTVSLPPVLVPPSFPPPLGNSVSPAFSTVGPPVAPPRAHSAPGPVRQHLRRARRPTTAVVRAWAGPRRRPPLPIILAGATTAPSPPCSTASSPRPRRPRGRPPGAVSHPSSCRLQSRQSFRGRLCLSACRNAKPPAYPCTKPCGRP